MALMVLTALEVGAQPGPAPKALAPRVALMDFVSDDNSYRSTVAVEDLMSALQVDISGDTNYLWVERAELEKAANEFKLAGLGLVDRSEAIRSGRWVKADWGIYGDLSTNFNGNRTLSLEIVNLQRADVLVETNLLLPVADSGPFQMKSEYVPSIASALRVLLNDARMICSDSENQDAVAFLFLSTTQNGLGDTFGGLDADFRSSLFAESTNHQRFHLVQFQRAGTAMDEANLVLGGLAESDSNSWEKVADHYVWGDARINEQKIFDEKTRGWRDERKVDVKLNVWDGKREPQVIAVTWTNETSTVVARELAQAIEPLFRQDETKPIVENVRSRISDAILTRYSGLPINFSFDSPDGRRQWFDAVQLLETACFFDPGNAAAREQLLRLRWGPAGRNEFFSARRRSEAWGKYVEQFGFTTALAKTNSPSIAAEYVLSAWRPFEMFGYAQENQAQWGVPCDAGLREITEWENQFGSEFISRLLKAPDQYSGAYRDALQRYFTNIGQPGGEQQLIAQLKAAIASNNTHPTNSNSPSPSQQVRLPRIAELASASEGDIFTPVRDIFPVRKMIFPPPLIEPDVQTISFPSGTQVHGVKSMAFHDDTLWLIVGVAEPLEIKTLNGQIEKEFQPVMVNHDRLWKLGVNAQKLEPVTGSLATNDVSSMLFHGDTLWLTLSDDGIAALNVKTGELRRYVSSNGLFPTNQFTLAEASREIMAIANQRMRDRIGSIHSVARDSSGTFWVASDSGLHGIDLNARKIRSQWISLSPTILATNSPSYYGQVQPPKSDAQLVKEIRQELELRRQLLEARKTDTNQPDLFVPSSRLTAGILSVTPDDDFLWVFTGETKHPLLYHPASQSWVGGFSINRMGGPSTLACGGGKLWLATQLWESVAILEIDTGMLKSTPRERWLPNNISKEELAARISGMSEHERAVYFFFSGNDADTVKLLQTQAEDNMGAESLFLLYSCYAEMGESNQASYFLQKLTQNFPNSVYTKALASDFQDMETRAKIGRQLRADPQPGSNTPETVSAWILRNCDVDGSGALNEFELTVFFEDKPDWIRLLVFNPKLQPATAVAILFRRWDGNRDGRLQSNELAAMAQHSFPAGWLAFPVTNSPFQNMPQPTKP